MNCQGDEEMNLGAPFPYFGGKKAIASIVWRALGDVKHYMEPFFGSGAVLLSRPGYDPAVHVETVCDKDGFIANVWRSLQFSPDETARWCDWPVNHADLNARRKALLANESRLLGNLIADAEWHDPVMAGYWIWAASCWIGRGLTRPNAIPHLADAGKGVHKLSQIPHLADAGKGVHKLSQRPHLADAGKGVQEPYNTNIYEWFRALSARLRNVRVVCGDWSRVCGGNWQDGFGIVGMFFDPPYGEAATRDTKIYHAESLTVANDVREWCIKRADNPRYRLVLAGYFEEHKSLLAQGWTVHRWKAGGGYSKLGKPGANLNRHREALFFSPHCLRPDIGNSEAQLDFYVKEKGV
ncbi:MAG: hypothetical protein WC455_14715 [Dehalococcoidia bacterium]|jgi:hypothetical protein